MLCALNLYKNIVDFCKMGRVMSRVYLEIDNINPILITLKKNDTVFSVDSQRDCAVPATQYASTKEANLSISTMVR